MSTPPLNSSTFNRLYERLAHQLRGTPPRERCCARQTASGKILGQPIIGQHSPTALGDVGRAGRIDQNAGLANQQRVRANEALAKVEIEAETAKQTTNFMTRLFEVSDPSEARGNTITAREIMDRGAERIQKELSAQPSIQATLMETMGTVYTSLGLYDQAVSLLQSALAKRKALYGEKHLEVARSLDRLGEVLKLKAEYERALPMYRQALALRREMLGNEHVDTARSVTPAR